MVIKYKAKYIRDGEVVIDDNALIELGGEAAQDNAASNVSRAKRNNAWDQLIAESEQRYKGVEPDNDSDNNPDNDSDNSSEKKSSPPE